MKQLIEKLKMRLSKKIVHKNLSECQVCGCCDFEKIGHDKVCKGCGAVY